MHKLIEFFGNVIQHPMVTDAAFALAIIVLLVLLKSVRLFLMRMIKSIDAAFSNESKKLGTAASNYSKIETELMTLRLALDADRINIYQFHNGSEFLLGGSIFKLTCSHEVVRDGLQFDSLKIHNTLISTVMDYVNPVMGSGDAYSGVKDIPWCKKAEKDDSCRLKATAMKLTEFRMNNMTFSNFKYIMDTQGTAVMYSTILSDAKTGKPIGILNIQFIDEDVDASLVRSKICDICLSVSKLQYLLSI